MIAKRDFILRGSCFCENYSNCFTPIGGNNLPLIFQIVQNPSFENYRNIKLILHTARNIPYDNMENIDMEKEGSSITFLEFLTMLSKVNVLYMHSLHIKVLTRPAL